MFRPMKGEDFPLEKELTTLRYPKCLTPKYDGFRIIMHPVHGVVTSTVKPFPNLHVRKTLEPLCGLGLDGEIIVGDHEKNYDFNITSGQLRRIEGQPNFTLFLFDSLPRHGESDHRGIFHQRWAYLKKCMELLKQFPQVKLSESVVAKSAAEVLAFEEHCLRRGYEGVMMRDPFSPYKYGKATLNEEYLLKLKRFKDHDAVIVGFEEMLSNGNLPTLDERGLTKRSSHQDGMIPAGTLGKLIVRGLEGPFKDQEFPIGTGVGLTHELRSEIWSNQSSYLGKKVTFKYQDHSLKNLPRLPVLKGIRVEE